MTPIRQHLYDAGGATRITNPYAHTPSFYRRHGYCLFRSALSRWPDPERFLARIRAEFNDNSESFGIVRNDRPVRGRANRAHSERRQIVSKTPNDNWRSEYFGDRCELFLNGNGDIFLFHPELLHCSDRYVESNLRLHYYIFARPRLIWRNVTFPARDCTLDLMQIEENRIVMQRNTEEGRHAARRRRRAAVAHFLENVRPRRSYR